MVFNGHTPESIANLDEVTMAQIQTMYADGAIGNNGLALLLGTLINGVFNYIRSPNSPSYKMSSILGRGSDYIFPPLSEAQQAAAKNDGLMAFMMQAPGFDMGLFNGK